jgi:hypothetical protein
MFSHYATLAALKLNPELVESLLDWCEAPPSDESRRDKTEGVSPLASSTLSKSFTVNVLIFS